MGTGRLMVWLKPGREQEDVFLPAEVAALLRLKIVRADRLSTLVAIAAAQRPDDPQSTMLWRSLMDAQQAYEDYNEVETNLHLARSRPDPKTVPSAVAPQGFIQTILSCGKRIWST